MTNPVGGPSQPIAPNRNTTQAPPTCLSEAKPKDGSPYTAVGKIAADILSVVNRKGYYQDFTMQTVGRNDDPALIDRGSAEVYQRANLKNSNGTITPVIVRISLLKLEASRFRPPVVTTVSLGYYDLQGNPIEWQPAKIDQAKKPPLKEWPGDQVFNEIQRNPGNAINIITRHGGSIDPDLQY